LFLDWGSVISFSILLSKIEKMIALDRLFNTTHQQPVEVIRLLIHHLQVYVTNTSIKEQLQIHPDYPSLLSLSDTLDVWNIQNVALKLESEQLKELDTPFVAHLYSNDGEYVFVTELNEEYVEFTDGTHKHHHVPINDFYSLWSGIVLLAEATEHSGEKDYQKKRKQELFEVLRTPSIILLFFYFVFVGIWQKGFTNWNEYGFISAKLLGLIFSIFLLQVEQGFGNILVNNICQIRKAGNCNNVLHSSASKLFGWLSWSEIGLLYFSGGFLTLLILSGSHWVLLKILAQEL
jgi:uncharacterized membrane protein